MKVDYGESCLFPFKVYIIRMSATAVQPFRQPAIMPSTTPHHFCDYPCAFSRCHLQRIPLHFSTGQYACFCITENIHVQPASPWRPLNSYDDECTSTTVIVVGNYEGNEYVLAGALTARRSFTHFLVRNRGSLPDYIEVRQEDIPEGDEAPEKLVVLEGNDWIDLLQQYASIAARENGLNLSDKNGNLTGYYSWHYYYDKITEDQYLQNAARMALANRSGVFSATVIQIDNGYQTAQGDWTSRNSAWSSPLKEVADRVIAMGLTPGIWLMPFVASTESQLYKEHTEWFVKNEDGVTPKQVIGWTIEQNNRWCCLDTTLPEVREHISSLMKQLHDWGFRYFKMTGLSFSMISGKRADTAATPLAAFRLGMKTIRESVPHDYIMASNTPFLPCLGYCNGVRVSSDTGANWEELKTAWQGMVSRFWMFDRWYRCDPDAIITRSSHLGGLTLAEARFSALNAIITGICMTGDRMEELEPARVQLLTIASKCRLRNLRPIDWKLNQWPMVFTGTMNCKKATALYNWTEHDVQFTRKDMNFSPKDHLAVILGEHPGTAIHEQLTLAPHDAALITVK